jgi:hypothetical protein
MDWEKTRKIHHDYNVPYETIIAWRLKYETE